MKEYNLESFEREIWKGIYPYEFDLQISNFGRVKRLSSQYSKWNKSKLGKPFLHNTKIEEKILKLNINRAGYFSCKTQVKGKSVSIKPHQEVARAFIPNPENKPCVNHIDSDKLNNRVSNLEWSTYSENNKHHYNNINHDVYGRIAKAFTGSVDAYNLITGEFVCKMSGNKEMREKGFDFRLVSAVLKGKRTSHRGCYFIKNDDNIQKELQTDQFSKSTFTPLDVFDKNGKYIFTLENYGDILDLKLTPQRVFDCLIGKAKQHKGFIFKLKQETNQ